MQLLTVDDFLPHVGKRARFKNTRFTLSIDGVTGDRQPPPGWSRAQFIVVFRGPKHPVMVEGLYECEIEDGPSYALYIAPVHTPQPEYQEYQAAFN